MRMADAETLPVRFDSFARTIAGYVDDLKKLTDKMRTDTEDRNRSLADHSFELAADPRVTYVAPQPKAPVPYLDFAPLENAVAKLRASAKAFEDADHGRAASASAAVRKQLDAIFIQADRAQLSTGGLPRRPWYKHEIYAPGFYTGYDVKTIPGVREAIEERRWDEANARIPIAAAALNAVATEIDRATKLLATP